jgi:hypothetical protein
MTERLLNASHLEDDVRRFEEEVQSFRMQLVALRPAIGRSELQEEAGRYTVRRKAELGLFNLIDG